MKTTLGPKGMDKILQSAYDSSPPDLLLRLPTFDPDPLFTYSSTGEIMVTNDGATILKSIALDNAAAKVLVNISKVQDDEVGDGTTSVTVLSAELSGKPNASSIKKFTLRLLLTDIGSLQLPPFQLCKRLLSTMPITRRSSGTILSTLPGRL